MQLENCWRPSRLRPLSLWSRLSHTINTKSCIISHTSKPVPTAPAGHAFQTRQSISLPDLWVSFSENCSQDGIGNADEQHWYVTILFSKGGYFTRSGPMRFPLTASSTAQTRCCYHRNTSKCGGSPACSDASRHTITAFIHTIVCVQARVGITDTGLCTGCHTA